MKILKVLIVDDSVSSQFQIVSYLQAHPEFERDAVKIAGDGSEAIASVEQYDIDVILMDIYMRDVNGITAAQKILNKYPEKKIIIITASHDESLVQQAFRAGVKGYLLKENIANNLVSTIQNIQSGYKVFPSFDKLPEQKRSLSRPDKILKINKIIASKLIYIWTNGSKEKEIELNTNSFIQEFKLCLDDKQNLNSLLLQGDSPNCDLIQELNLRFERLVSIKMETDKEDIKTDLIESQSEEIIEQLNYWFYTENSSETFSSFKSRIEANAQVLRVRQFQDLKEFLNPIISTTAPMPCLMYLEAIEQLLKDKAKSYQQKLDRYQKEEESTSGAYQNLLYRLYFVYQPKNKKFRQDQIKTITAITRAILFVYLAKMQSQSSSLAVQMLEGLVRSVQLYIDDIILTINLLNRVQNELDISHIEENISSFIEKEFTSFNNPIEMLQEVETKFGCPINQWGIRGNVNSSEISSELLDRISPQSEKILCKIEQSVILPDARSMHQNFRLPQKY